MAKAPQPVAKKSVVEVPDVLRLRLDRTERKKWFKGQSKDVLFHGTEADLVKKACEVSGYTPEGMLHEAVMIEARRLLANALSGKTGRGIEGSADARIVAAYNLMVREGYPARLITPGRLKSRCVPPLANALSAKRWLERRALGSFSPEALAAAPAAEPAKQVPAKSAVSPSRRAVRRKTTR